MKKIILFMYLGMFLIIMSLALADATPFNRSDRDSDDNTWNFSSYPSSGTSVVEGGWIIEMGTAEYGTNALATEGTMVIQSASGSGTNLRALFPETNLLCVKVDMYYNATNPQDSYYIGLDVDGADGGTYSTLGRTAGTSESHWISRGNSGGCAGAAAATEVALPVGDGWVELAWEHNTTHIIAYVDEVEARPFPCGNSYKALLVASIDPAYGLVFDNVRYCNDLCENCPIVLDTTAPTYADNSTNRSFPFPNDFVNISINWTDENPAQAWFGNNFSGVWANSTPIDYVSGTIINNVSQVTAAVGSSVCWQGYANDTGGFTNETLINCITITENLAPTITIFSPSNNSVFSQFNSNITFNVGCDDNNPNILNFTFFNSSESLFSVQNSTPSGNILNLSGVIDISSFGSGSYFGNFSCSDTHTADLIKDYSVTKITSKRKLLFDTGTNKINITILTKPTKLTLSKIISKKNFDRYSFEFGSYKEQNSFTILLETEHKLKRIKNSDYLGHFVSNKNWIDFENEGNITSFDVLQRDNNSFWIFITTDNLNFNSIGGLNIVTKTFNFELDTTAPIISIITPLNRSYFSSSNIINFNYTYIETTNISNCSLILNGNTNETNTGQNFTIELQDREHNFNINCIDGLGNVGTSETRVIVVSLTPLSINTNITYNSDFFLFNVSGDHPTNITILPNSENPFEVCLEDEINISNCINYTEGFYNKTFSWVGIIDWRRYFRFRINWTRYDNGSDIKLINKSSETSTYFNFDRQSPVIFSGDLTTNSNVTYEPAHEIEFVTPSFEFNELSHNITFFDELTNVVATLVYNDTENVIDGTNFSIVGDNKKFVVTFFKNVSIETTFPFFWNYSFDLPNGTTLTFNTSTFNQVVNELSFNTSCDFPIMNITLSDEETLGLLDSDLELSIERMFFGSSVVELNTSFNLTGVNTTEICFNAEDLEVRFDIVLNYESSGYTPRIYNFLDTLTSNITRILPLYLSNDGNITNIFITLFDQNSERLNNHYVKADRFYPGSNFYKNIETVKSDVNGETLFHLIPFSIEYRFRIFNFAGDEIKRVEKTTIKSSSPSITIQTGEAFLEGLDALDSAAKSLTFDNDTKEVVWQTTTTTFPKSCLAVIRLSSGGKTLYDNCQEGAVVVDSYTITENTTDEFYEFRGYFLDGGGRVISGDFMSHSEPSAPFRYGLLGVLLTLVITVVLFMLGINNPATAITLGFVGLLISAYLKFVILSFAMVVLLAIMVGFLLYKMRT